MPPMLTVVVLTVLWIIVVVPMIFPGARRRARRRLRRTGPSAVRAVSADDRTRVMPRVIGWRAASRPAIAESHEFDIATNRRPVPVVQEAAMEDRSEMSAGRRAMMARRRRALSALGLGSAAAIGIAVLMGGVVWLVAGAFLFCLAGYLLFLRRQALRDRDRRAARQLRSVSRRPRMHDVPAIERIVAEPSTQVRIDDDDPELQTLDTVDLAGVYGEGAAVAQARRRAG